MDKYYEKSTENSALPTFLNYDISVDMSSSTKEQFFLSILFHLEDLERPEGVKVPALPEKGKIRNKQKNIHNFVMSTISNQTSPKGQGWAKAHKHEFCWIVFFNF